MARRGSAGCAIGVPVIPNKNVFLYIIFYLQIYAWKIADEMLLHQNELGLEALYFSAQTMRQKVQNAFLELPPESHVSLRDSLIEHLCRTNETSGRTIVTQLALALADLALQMSTWEKPVVFIIEKMGQKGSVVALLEVLTVMPEEINALKLGKNRRQEFEEELKSAGPIVLDLLVSVKCWSLHFFTC